MSKIPQEMLNSDWYKSRPEIIKKAMEIWSFGDNFLVDDKVIYLLGYSETTESQESNDPHDLMLILTDIDPCENYELAEERAIRICASHFRREATH